MLPSLRGLLTLREGAGLLPALLLEWGQLPCSTHSQALRCRDKGKPAAKRGRKAHGPPRARWEEVAGLSNGDGGGATKRASPLWEGGGRGCQPKSTTGDFHPGLTHRRQNLPGPLPLANKAGMTDREQEQKEVDV